MDRKKWERRLMFSTYLVVSILCLAMFVGEGFIHRKILWPLLGIGVWGYLNRFVLRSFRVGNYRTIFWGFSVFMGLSIVAGCFFFIPDMDREKTFIPFVEAVKTQISSHRLPPEHVLGYNLNEMERGVFSFYLENNFTNLKTGEALKDLLNQPTAIPYILMTNRNSEPKIASIIQNNFALVHQYRPDQKRRSYNLYINRS